MTTNNLEENSKHWSEFYVRRTMIIIEQLLKLATRAYIKESNTKIHGMQ